MAACLSAGSGSAVSHRAAARIWEVDRLRSAPLEISVPAGRQPRLHGVSVHRASDLHPEDIRRVGAMPVTSPARTLVDLGAVARPWLVERALDSRLVAGHVGVDEVSALLDVVARKGRSGAGVLRAVLARRALGDAAPDSLAEAMLARILAAHGVPAPTYHHLVTIAGEVFEVDFAYPEAKLAIEVDGYGPHSSREAFERDRRRQNLMEEDGWRFLRYTPAVLTTRAGSVAAQVHRLLRRSLCA
jgi:very-short-patch-repair endonuclease